MVLSSIGGKEEGKEGRRAEGKKEGRGGRERRGKRDGFSEGKKEGGKGGGERMELRRPRERENKE